MDRLNEFPALENRRAYLEHALYEATQQTEALVYEGKSDKSIGQWLEGLRAELRELRYALAMLYQQDDNRIEMPNKMAILAIMIVSVVILLQIVVLIGLP